MGHADAALEEAGTNQLFIQNLVAEKEIITLQLDELERALLQTSKKTETERKAYEAALEVAEKEKDEANEIMEEEKKACEAAPKEIKNEKEEFKVQNTELEEVLIDKKKSNEED